MNEIALQIAVTYLRDVIPKNTSLVDRIKFAMRYVCEHEHDLFWMSGNTGDEVKFRAAVAAVILNGSEEEKDIIKRSMMPLRMVSAAMSGIPVDLGALPIDYDLLPLLKLWNESKPNS